jgi:hypothetical protein
MTLLSKKLKFFRKQIVREDVLNLYKKLKKYEEGILNCDPNFKAQ